MSSLLGTPSAALSLISKATTAAAKATSAAASYTTDLARESMSAALETATIEYDAVGHATVVLDDGVERRQAPAPTTPTRWEGDDLVSTPISAASDADVDGRIRAMLREREELQEQLRVQLEEMRREMERRVEAANERARAAAEREHAAEQQGLHTELQLSESEAARLALEQQRDSLLARCERDDAASAVAATAAAATAAASVTDDEVARLRSDLDAVHLQLAQAERRNQQLEEVSMPSHALCCPALPVRGSRRGTLRPV
jgi:hypothetical protein